MEDHVDRYSRHILLRLIGEEGQAKIAGSKVFVAGVGALGSTIAILLARAGVGFMRIADRDRPEMHNLHRQILYDEADVERGLSKAEIARDKLKAANSSVRIEAVTTHIGTENIVSLIEGVDLVIDGLDNMATRYIVNDAIVERGIPFVFGGAVETAGNVMVIVPGKTPCLRCLWPQSEAIEGHARASQVGVLSSVATAVASVQVTEAMKIMAHRTEDLLQGLLVMDFRRNMYQTVPVLADPTCGCMKL